MTSDFSTPTADLVQPEKTSGLTMCSTASARINFIRDALGAAVDPKFLYACLVLKNGAVQSVAMPENNMMAIKSLLKRNMEAKGTWAECGESVWIEVEKEILRKHGLVVEISACGSAALDYVTLLTSILDIYLHDASCFQTEEVIPALLETAVVKGVEILIIVGISPTLDDGVGIPVEKRINTFCSLKEMNILPKIEHETTRALQLLLCSKPLLKLYENAPFRGVAVSKFLNDILVVVLQLDRLMGQMTWNPLFQGLDCKLWLRTLVKEVHKPVMIPELISLQRGCGHNWKSPAWLRKEVGALLSLCLTEDSGLLSLMQSISTDNWETADAVALIVSRCPYHMRNEKKNYLMNICHQLLTMYESGLLKQYERKFCAIVFRLQVLDADLVNRYLFSQIFSPFVSLLAENKSQSIPCSGKLSQSIQAALSLSRNCPSETRNSLQPYFNTCIPLVFEILCCSGTANQELKKMLEELLFCYFSNCKEDEYAVAIELLELVRLQKRIYNRSLRQDLKFVVDGNGIRITEKLETEEDKDSAQVLERKLLCVVDLSGMLAAYLSSLPWKLIGVCLEEARKLSSELESPSKEEKYYFVEKERAALILEDYLRIISLLEAFVEKFQASLCKAPQEFFKIANVILQNCNCVLPSENNSVTTMSRQIISLVFGLVTSVIVTADGESTEVLMGPALQITATVDSFKDCKDEHIQESAVALAKLLREVFQSCSSQSGAVEASKETTWDKICVDLKDPLPAVRGHALIQLEKLILQRNPAVIGSKNDIFSLLCHHLEDSDSYVFLATINTMTALCSVLPADGVTYLLDLFLSEKSSPEVRLKTGEVLSKFVSSLGGLASKYSNMMVPGFLSLAANPDETIRSSCLSCLGELCSHLSFKLNDHLHEMVFCVEKLLRFDESSLVRRSAMNLSKSILCGAGKDMFEVLGDALPHLYRTVKFLHRNDRDETVQLHAELCLAEIDHHMKEMLIYNPQNLIKEIKLVH